MAKQAAAHHATVARNAQRLGSSLRELDLAPEEPAEPEEPDERPKRRGGKKPAKRKAKAASGGAQKGKRAKRTSDADEAEPLDPSRPDRFCDVAPLLPNETSTKLRRLVAVVQARAPGKVVIFSQFVAALELAQRALRAAGLHSVAPALAAAEARPAAVEAFVNEEAITCLLLTLDHSQSAGLTLTVASTVVLLDPVLDTAIEDQAIARVHRIGQASPVTAIRLCAADSVDLTIAALQEVRRGAKRQRHHGDGTLRVAELIKLFAIDDEDA
jgi:SNF2 family DNA or RNA helicase